MSGWINRLKQRRPYWPATLAASIIWLGGAVSLWYLLPVRPRVVLESPDCLRMVDFTADGQTLVTETARTVQDREHGGYSGVRSGPIRRWDVRTGRLVDELHLPEDSPSGPKFADRDDRLGALQENGNSIGNVALAPGGQAIVYQYQESVNLDPSLRLFSFTAGREVLRLESADVLSSPFSPDVSSSPFSPDGRWIGVDCLSLIDGGRSLRVFESTTGNELVLIDPAGLLISHTAYCFSPDSSLIALRASGKGPVYVYIWDLATRRLLSKIPGWYEHMTLSPDNKTLAVDGDSNAVKLFAVETGQLRAELHDHDDGITALAYSADGRTLTAYNDFINGQGLHRATTWDAVTGELVQRFDRPVKEAGCEDPNESPTPRLVVQYHGSDWTFYDVISGEPLGTWSLPLLPHRVSPDGRTLVTIFNDYSGTPWYRRWLEDHVPGFTRPVYPYPEPRLWDIASGRELAQLPEAMPPCRFSPDGLTLLTYENSPEARIQLWDMPPRRSLGRILGWPLLPALLVLLWGCRRVARRPSISTSAPAFQPG